MENLQTGTNYDKLLKLLISRTPSLTEFEQHVGLEGTKSSSDCYHHYYN